MQTNMQAIQNTQLALQAMVESLARDRDRKLMLERLYTDAAADRSRRCRRLRLARRAAAGDAASTLPANATPQQRLEAARSLLAQMELRLSPKHPDVVRTKRLIEDLERQVAAEDLQRPLSPEAGPDRPASPEEIRRRDRLREMRAEIESLDRQIAFKEGEERRLRGEIGVYQARLEAVPGIESEWVALTRDYDTLQATYRELLSKSENSKMAASLEQRQIGEQFRILDPPRVPLKPHSPNRIRINLIGTLAGLGLGLLLLGLAQYRDSTMRSEADVLGAIELPVLALVPFVTTEADLRRQRRRRWLVAAAVVAVVRGHRGPVLVPAVVEVRRVSAAVRRSVVMGRIDEALRRSNLDAGQGTGAEAPAPAPRPGGSSSTKTPERPRARRALGARARGPARRRAARVPQGTAGRRGGAGSTPARSNGSSCRRPRRRCSSSSSGASRRPCTRPSASSPSRASS